MRIFLNHLIECECILKWFDFILLLSQWFRIWRQLWSALNNAQYLWRYWIWLKSNGAISVYFLLINSVYDLDLFTCTINNHFLLSFAVFVINFLLIFLFHLRTWFCSICRLLLSCRYSDWLYPIWTLSLMIWYQSFWIRWFFCQYHLSFFQRVIIPLLAVIIILLILFSCFIFLDINIWLSLRIFLISSFVSFIFF